jgi:hypothetical protein
MDNEFVRGVRQATIPLSFTELVSLLYKAKGPVPAQVSFSTVQVVNAVLLEKRKEFLTVSETKWANVYRRIPGDNILIASDVLHDSKEKAEAHASKYNDGYVGAFPITITRTLE